LALANTQVFFIIYSVDLLK